MVVFLLKDLHLFRFYVPAIKFFLTIIFLLNAIQAAAQAIFTVPERDADGNFTVSWTKVNAFGALHEVVNGNFVKLTDFGATPGSFEVRGKPPGAYTYRLTEGRAGSQQIEYIYTTKTIIVGVVAPTISAIANRTIPEDTSTGAISFTVSDADTPANTLLVTALSSSNPTLIPLSNVTLTPVPWGSAGTNRTVSVTPAANAFGSSFIVLQVSDEGNRSATAGFWVTVTAVNDPPSITAISSISVGEGVLKVGPIEFSISDPDPTDTLSVSVESSNHTVVPPSGIIITGSGNKRFITISSGTSPHQQVVGSAEIKVNVFDGAVFAPNPGKFTYTINDRPATLSLSSETGKPEAINLQWDFANIGVRIKESFNGGPETEPADLGAGSRVGSKQILRPRNGIYTYTIYDCFYSGGSSGAFTDCSRQTDSKSVQVTMPVPVVTAAFNQLSVDEGGRATLNWSSTNATSCSATGIAGVSAVAGNVTYNAPSVMVANQVASVQVICTGPGGSASATASINVSAVNDVPVFSLSPAFSTAEDTVFYIPFSLHDEETPNTLIKWAITSTAPSLIPSAGVEVDISNSRLKVTPAPNANGSVDLNVRITDESGASVDRPVKVSVTAVNDRPTISNIPNISTNQDTSTGEIVFTVHDVDSDNLSVSATSASGPIAESHITLRGSGNNRTISIMPPPAWYGSSLVTVKVSDGSLDASDDFIVTIVDIAPKLFIDSDDGAGNHQLSWKYANNITRMSVSRNGGAPAPAISDQLARGSQAFAVRLDGTYVYSLYECEFGYGSSNCNNFKDSVTVNVTLPIPDTPVFNTSVINNSDGNYEVSWSSVARANSYELQENGVNVDNGGNPLMTTKPFSSKATNVYSYRIRACNRAGCSPFSTAFVKQVARLPGSVTGVTATMKSVTGVASLTWEGASAAYYEIQSRLNTGAWSTPNSVTSKSATLSAVTVEGNYSYQVRACNSAGNFTSCSGWALSNSVSGVRPPVPVMSIPAINTTGSFNAEWADVINRDYFVINENGVDLVPSITTTNKGFIGKTNGRYTYTLKACNVFGCGSPSASKVTDVAVVGTMGGVTAIMNQTNGVPSLSWPSVTGATRYDIQATLDGANIGNVISTPTPSLSLAAVTTPGNYAYKVSACAVVGANTNCTAAKTSNIISPLYPSSAPLLRSPLNSATGAFTPKWTAVANGDRYEVYENNKLISTTTSLSLTFTGATAKTTGTYHYKVRGCKAVCGPFSNLATVNVVVGSSSSSAGSATVLNQPTIDPINDAMTENVYKGALTGRHSVGNDGSFNYSLPIAIPEGINGAQPNLQLSYNSNVKNGLVGWGWTLYGLSVISRCNANMIRDGYVSGIQSDDNYKYCIDGKRLVEVSAGEYRTESESFLLIKKLGDYWEVTNNNGTQSRYGHNPDSRQEDDQGQAYAWHLDQQEDVSSNSWSVTYNKSSALAGQTHYPESISYTNRPSLTASQSVVFHYENREDILVKYVAGVLTKNDKRLAEIEVKSAGTTVYSYKLAYQESGETYHGKPYSDPARTSRLASITQCFGGSSEDCAATVQFDWSAQHASNYMFTKVPYVKPGPEANGAFSRLPTNIPEGHRSFRADRVLGMLLSSDIIVNDPANKEQDKEYKYDFVDMNGDGLLDKVRYPDADCFGAAWWCRYDNVQGQAPVPQDISVAINTGSAFSAYKVWYDKWGCPDKQTRGCNLFSHKLLFVDINGDGLRDLFAMSAYPISGAARTHVIGYNNGRGISGGAFISVQDPGISWSNTALNGDFNGDGIIDIANMEIHADKITVQMGEGKIRASNGEIKSFLPRVNALVGNYFLNDCGKTPPEKPRCFRAVKDFNNDGLDDILEWTGSSNAQVYISLGGSAQGSIRFAPPVLFFNSELFQAIASDNQPGNFLLANQLVDWNRDGFYEFLHSSSSGNHFSDAKNNLVVNRIETVLEASRSIKPTYEPLSSDLVYEYLPAPFVTEEANQLVVPEVMKGNRFGVRDIQITNGVGGVNTTRYKYIGAKTHGAGYADLGFATVEKLEVVTGKTPVLTVSDFYQEATSTYKLAGRLKREVVYLNDVSGPKISDTRYQWKVRIYNDDVDVGHKSPHYFAYLYQSSNKSWELDGTTLISETLTQNRADAIQSCTEISSAPSVVVVNAGAANDSDYTADGVLLYSQTATCDQSGSSASVQVKAVENLDITSTGDARALVQKRKQYAWTGSAISSASKSFYDVRTQAFTYNALGQLESKTIEPEVASPNSLKLTTNYLYNGFGSVRQITDSWDDSANDGLEVNTRVTTIDETYTNGIRKLVVTKPLNIRETTEFHPRWGTPTKQTDANGLETNTRYDAQGRPERIDYADGTSTQIDYRSCSGCSPYHSNAVWYKQVKTTGSSAVRSYHDGFNREVGTRSSGMDGSAVYSVQTYDSTGAPFESTAPFYYGEAQKIVATYYDALGRVSRVDHPDGSSETHGYYGLRHTTTNRLNQTQTRYLNAAGWVMRSVDNANTPVDFTYWPWGDLKTTQVNNDTSTLVSVFYDALGRKTSMTDPNTGTTTYTYNALDLVATQTDAKNQRTCFGYDALGRQTKRVDNATSSCTGRVQNWVYDTKTKGKGQLGSMSGVNTDGTSYSEQYSFTAYGLPESTTSSFDGSAYTVTQHYDAFNRPLGVTYPTGYVAANSYNSYGHLDQVKDSTGATLWTANEADALGNIQQFTLGNGSVTTQTYNANTGRIESIRAVSGSLVIQDQHYQFDELGNLRSREDRKDTITQSFCYDGLNRLKAARFTGCSSAANDYNYDPLGNLTTKEGLAGTLGYGTSGTNVAGPHAVTSANGWAYRYDAIGNLTSATKAGQPTKTVAYSPFNTPTSITQGSKFSTVVYGPNQDRIKHSDSNGRVTKYVGGIYEEVTKAGVTQKIHYVGDFALVIQTGSVTPVTKHEYLHRDHIGSIIAISKGTVASANDVQWQANGAWGERRFNQWNGPLDNMLIPASTARGFTDHEHLDAVGLIHMNGRVYDPELGRFMSADPFVQAPYNSQSYNRYSYVFNNPLSFTDPSGYECVSWTTRDDESGNSSSGTSGDCKTYTGMDAYYFSLDWQNQINQSLESLVGGAFNFTGIPTAFNAAIDVHVAMNMGDHSAIGPIVAIAAVELVTKKVERVPALAKVAEAVEKKVEKALRKSGVPDKNFEPNKTITQKYERPSGAGPTSAQKASVQGQPCVDCGAVTKKQVADHKDPLVVQYYREGNVNILQQRQLNAVQPHCPSCSNIQGGQLGAFGKKMMDDLGL